MPNFFVGNKFINSILFVVLCFIWGSSFILMKLGMFDENQQVALSPYHVAAIRMFSCGIVMVPFIYNALKTLPKATIKYILLSGWVGSFIPAFLFCIAETKIDGSVAGSLNSLTPLFVIVTGVIFFNIDTTRQKIIGVLVGLLGCVLLTLAKADQIKSFGDIGYSGFIILATVLYGINVNMVHKRLHGVSSMQIATVAFTGLIIPALVVLWITGYFQLPLSDKKYLISSVAGSVLGIVNTTVASVLFYMLIKRAGGLLASLVTYGVPLVAIGWGIYYGEKINFLQVTSLLIILSGVYIAYRQKKS